MLEKAGALQLLIGLNEVWGQWYKRSGTAKVSSKSDAEKFEKDLPLVLNQCGHLAGYPAGTAFPRSVSNWPDFMLSQYL